MTFAFQVRRIVSFGRYAVGRTVWYGCGLGAVVVLLFQATRWLQDGSWTSMPLNSAFVWIALRVPSAPTVDAFLHWNVNPSSWIGLHTLTEMPTVVALLIGALLGLIISANGFQGRRRLAVLRKVEDWHRTRIDRRRDTIELALDAVASDSESNPASTPRSVSNSSDITSIDRDVLRWLAMNGADERLNTLEVMVRNLKHFAPELNLSTSTLAARGFITSIAGHFQLADNGRALCIEQGWTMPVPRRN